MKKIIILISSVLLFCGNILLAQTSANRTPQTIIADALAQMPAQSPDAYLRLITDLC